MVLVGVGVFLCCAEARSCIQLVLMYCGEWARQSSGLSVCIVVDGDIMRLMWGGHLHLSWFTEYSVVVAYLQPVMLDARPFLTVWWISLLPLIFPPTPLLSPSLLRSFPVWWLIFQ